MPITMHRPARIAVFGIFALNGFLFAMWVVHIPSITERTGTSKSTLGGLLLVLAAGALVGMRLSGPLADRFGSRTLTGASALALSVAVSDRGSPPTPPNSALPWRCSASPTARWTWR